MPYTSSYTMASSQDLSFADVARLFRQAGYPLTYVNHEAVSDLICTDAYLEQDNLTSVKFECVSLGHAVEVRTVRERRDTEGVWHECASGSYRRATHEQVLSIIKLTRATMTPMRVR